MADIERSAFYRIVPVTFAEARDFVNAHHRHNVAPQGHRFSVGIESNGELAGVVIVGRPVARGLDDGLTCEITRCCVAEGLSNANSCLYGAALRAAKAMGFRRAVTYTLTEESGSSLRAVGFRPAAAFACRDWDTPSRPRRTLEAPKYPRSDRIRWEKQLNASRS